MSNARSVPVVVIDSNIVVSALISPTGTSQQVLAVWEQGACVAVSSTDLNGELADVLSRPRIRSVFRVSPLVATRYLEDFIANQVQPTLIDSLPVHCRDPKDDLLLACALAAHADYIVTNDADLLVLNEHPALGALRIVSSAEFLAVLSERGQLGDAD